MTKEKTLKTLKDITVEEVIKEWLIEEKFSLGRMDTPLTKVSYDQLRRLLYLIKQKERQLAIKWIKKIRLAKAWRSYQLRDSNNVSFRNKPLKPKEEMDEEEINFLMQFGFLSDDKPCNFIKHFFNIPEEDFK